MHMSPIILLKSIDFGSFLVRREIDNLLDIESHAVFISDPVYLLLTVHDEEALSCRTFFQIILDMFAIGFHCNDTARDLVDLFRLYLIIFCWMELNLTYLVNVTA